MGRNHLRSLYVFLALACYIEGLSAKLSHQWDELEAVETTSTLLRNATIMEAVYDENADVIYVFSGKELETTDRSGCIQRYSVSDGGVSLIEEIKDAKHQSCITADGMGSFYTFVYLKAAPDGTTVYRFIPATKTLHTIAVSPRRIWGCVAVNQSLVLALSPSWWPGYISVTAFDPTTKTQRDWDAFPWYDESTPYYNSKVAIGPNPGELSVFYNDGKGHLYRTVYNYDSRKISSSKRVNWVTLKLLRYFMVGEGLWLVDGLGASPTTGNEVMRFMQTNQNLSAFKAWRVKGVTDCWGCGYAYAKRWNRIYIFGSWVPKDRDKIYYVDLAGIVNLTSQPTKLVPVHTLPMISENVTTHGDPTVSTGHMYHAFLVLITSLIISCVILIFFAIMRRRRRRISLDGKITFGSPRRWRNHENSTRSVFNSEQIRLHKYEANQGQF